MYLIMQIVNVLYVIIGDTLTKYMPILIVLLRMLNSVERSQDWKITGFIRYHKVGLDNSWAVSVLSVLHSILDF